MSSLPPERVVKTRPERVSRTAKRKKDGQRGGPTRTTREKGVDADQFPDSTSSAMGASRPRPGVWFRAGGGMLESTRVNFTAPTLAGRSKKNQEASRLPTVMTLGGVLQHAVAMLASGEDHQSGPRRFLAPNPFWRWRLTGGFIPCRAPGWAPGTCCQSADTASRDVGVVTRLVRAPITDPGFLFLQLSAEAGMGRPPRWSQALSPATLDEFCLARSALFQDDRGKIRSLDLRFRSLRNLVPPRLGCWDNLPTGKAVARNSRVEKLG